MRMQHNLEQQIQARNTTGVTEEALKEFSMMFKHFDKDKSGRLNHQEFQILPSFPRLRPANGGGRRTGSRIRIHSRHGGSQQGRPRLPAGIHGLHDQPGDGERQVERRDRKRLPGPELRGEALRDQGGVVPEPDPRTGRLLPFPHETLPGFQRPRASLRLRLRRVHPLPFRQLSPTAPWGGPPHISRRPLSRRSHPRARTPPRFPAVPALSSSAEALPHGATHGAVGQPPDSPPSCARTPPRFPTVPLDAPPSGLVC
ncbi:spectrin alpha chain-like [Podarcis lilfordi]|nr:spectrin alpha chain-like [Podarcis lilfordi]